MASCFNPISNLEANMPKEIYYTKSEITNLLKGHIGGQFVDYGTSVGSGIQYMAQVSAVEDIVVKAGTNAFSVDSFTLADGATLTVEDGATYKVI